MTKQKIRLSNQIATSTQVARSFTSDKSEFQTDYRKLKIIPGFPGEALENIPIALLQWGN